MPKIIDGVKKRKADHVRWMQTIIGLIVFFILIGVAMWAYHKGPYANKNPITKVESKK